MSPSCSRRSTLEVGPRLGRRRRPRRRRRRPPSAASASSPARSRCCRCPAGSRSGRSRGSFLIDRGRGSPRGLRGRVSDPWLLLGLALRLGLPLGLLPRGGGGSSTSGRRWPPVLARLGLDARRPCGAALAWSRSCLALNGRRARAPGCCGSRRTAGPWSTGWRSSSRRGRRSGRRYHRRRRRRQHVEQHLLLLGVGAGQRVGRHVLAHQLALGEERGGRHRQDQHGGQHPHAGVVGA